MSTTVFLPTTGTLTRTAVTLTLTSLLVSNSSISAPRTMAMTATTVYKSADKVQCTSSTTATRMLSVTFGPTISRLYRTAVPALLDQVRSLHSGPDTTLTTATPPRALTVQHTTASCPTKVREPMSPLISPLTLTGTLLTAQFASTLPTSTSR